EWPPNTLPLGPSWASLRTRIQKERSLRILNPRSGASLTQWDKELLPDAPGWYQCSASGLKGQQRSLTDSADGRLCTARVTTRRGSLGCGLWPYPGYGLRSPGKRSAPGDSIG